ncbi:MAG: FAD-dependent oxidoreductase [Lactobacillus sp.]|jgi:rhodanese-related sulfurtransferase|nr:FAD-dependent oxidoreductase [Lactobacillus sp.]
MLVDMTPAGLAQFIADQRVPVLEDILELGEVEVDLKQTAKTVILGADENAVYVARDLKDQDLAATLVTPLPHIISWLDEEMAAFLLRELTSHGIQVFTGQAQVTLQADHKAVVLRDGTVLPADLVYLDPGDLAEKLAGTYFDWYAAGDIYALGKKVLHPPFLLGGVYTNLGKSAMAPVVSKTTEQHYTDPQIKLSRAYDLMAGGVGRTEEQVKAAGLTVDVIHVLGKIHDPDDPEITLINLKLVFNPKDGAIYGAQIVGPTGVVKRIGILAEAMKSGLTIADLADIEVVAKPPYRVIKDPINMLGDAAVNLTHGLSQHIQWYDLPAALAKGAKILDVRNPDEIAAGHFPDSVNIPLHQLRERLSELDENQAYIVSCRSGERSYMAYRFLVQHGFDVTNLDGGYQIYQAVRPQDLVYLQ